MCGIVGVISKAPVNQLIYDALLLLQHRGQDAAGIVTEQGRRFFMHKAKGMVRDVFRTRNMRSLPGEIGIAHCRYPTAGSASNAGEAQLAMLAAFGRAFGLAFQIADDLLDIEGNVVDLGKTPGKDVEAGKATFVSILGVERARTQAGLLARQAAAHLESFGEAADLLRQAANFVVARRT